HSIRLRAFDRGGDRQQADLAGEAAGVAGDVTRAVITQPFDGLRQPIDEAEAVLDGGDHEIAHILSLDTLRGGDMAHGFAVATVEGEGDAHLVAVIAAYLEAVGTPAQIGVLDRDAPVMATLDAAGMAFEEQAMDTHDPVNPFVVGSGMSFGLGAAAQN